MAFTNNFRIERVYFERLKTMIDVLKAFKDNVTDEPTRTLLENSIDVDGATLLLYRNLGEAWAELADLIQKTRELLQSLDEKTEKYHDELNERIDEVNNYLMALIRALEARVDAIESDLAQMGRLFTYELTRVNDSYALTESGNPVTFSDTAAKYAHNRAHLVTVRGNVDGETTYFFPREYDTSTESGLFEWYAFGFVGIEIHEITVTLLPDNSVNVSIERTDFADIRSKIASLTIVTNDLISRMTNAETDIDTLEATAENLEANKQDKLIAGSGISIDEETGIISASGGFLYGGFNSRELRSFVLNDTTNSGRSDAGVIELSNNEEFTGEWLKDAIENNDSFQFNVEFPTIEAYTNIKCEISVLMLVSLRDVTLSKSRTLSHKYMRMYRAIGTKAAQLGVYDFFEGTKALDEYIEANHTYRLSCYCYIFPSLSLDIVTISNLRTNYPLFIDTLTKNVRFKLTGWHK